MNKLIIYHGSSQIVQKPIFGAGKSYNDYGQGFYCTEHLELAKEWACNEERDGYANQYELDTKGLQILNLSSSKYNILHWLTLLLECRGLRLSTPVMAKGSAWLKEHFLINLDDYDLITGYRADDSYFSFARAFVNNEISLNQLSYAMRLGKLGEQIVLKSPKAFEHIKFISYEVADNQIYYMRRKKRDIDARNAFFAELEKDDMSGIFLRDIIRGEVTLDELCL